MTARTTVAWLESIEDQTATLLLEEDGSVVCRLPASLLPEGSLPGTALTLTLGVDADRTETLHRDVAALRSRLSRRHGSES